MRVVENSASRPSGNATSNKFDSAGSETDTVGMVYTILTAECDELVELVNRYIAEGWEPLGGIARASYSQWFSQAMIRPRQRDC
jgi:hypothetical protein